MWQAEAEKILTPPNWNNQKDNSLKKKELSDKIFFKRSTFLDLGTYKGIGKEHSKTYWLLLGFVYLIGRPTYLGNYFKLALMEPFCRNTNALKTTHEKLF